MYVGSAFFFDIKTQDDLNKAMVASFEGIFEGGGAPEFRLIKELIDAVQNADELSHLTLDIPEVLDIIRQTQNDNLNPEIEHADIRNYITMYHFLKNVPEYKSVMEGVQKSFNLYVLNSNTAPSDTQNSSNISIAVVPGRYEALWITGQEINLRNPAKLPSLNEEFNASTDRIKRHISKLGDNPAMSWLHDFAPKNAGVYEEKLNSIFFGRTLNPQPVLMAPLQNTQTVFPEHKR